MYAKRPCMRSIKNKRIKMKCTLEEKHLLMCMGNSAKHGTSAAYADAAKCSYASEMKKKTVQRTRL